MRISPRSWPRRSSNRAEQQPDEQRPRGSEADRPERDQPDQRAGGHHEEQGQDGVLRQDVEHAAPPRRLRQRRRSWVAAAAVAGQERWSPSPVSNVTGAPPGVGGQPRGDHRRHRSSCTWPRPATEVSERPPGRRVHRGPGLATGCRERGGRHLNLRLGPACQHPPRSVRQADRARRPAVRPAMVVGGVLRPRTRTADVEGHRMNDCDRIRAAASPDMPAVHSLLRADAVDA